MRDHRAGKQAAEGGNGVALTSDTLTKLVNRWPASRIDDLMPWNHAKAGAQPVNV
jgi:hypothetical protein